MQGLSSASMTNSGYNSQYHGLQLNVERRIAVNMAKYKTFSAKPVLVIL